MPKSKGTLGEAKSQRPVVVLGAYMRIKVVILSKVIPAFQTTRSRDMTSRVSFDAFKLSVAWRIL